MARIGPLSLSDGRDFVSRDLRDFIGGVEARIAGRLELAGHEVWRGLAAIQEGGSS